LARLVRRADVVHVFHLRNPLGPLAFALARLFRRPLVFSEAGLLHDEYISGNRDDPLAAPLRTGTGGKPLGARIRHRILHGADAVVFLSRHNIEIAERLGLDMGKVSYLPHIRDGRRFPAGQLAGHSIDDKTEMPLPKRFGLFVGQMKLRKGWDVLMRAVALDKGAGLPFVIVSPSSAVPPESFRNLADQLGIEARVFYIGSAPNSLLQSLYHACELVVVPSRYEGFGLVSLEAFEAGKPVIASDVPALNEYLSHGVNAYLFPKGDASRLAEGIAEVLSDGHLRDRLVAGGRQCLEYFYVDRWLPAWIEVYKAVAR
jgi:glycosyltransferase involved in cell wall biosynthesis